MSQVNQLLLTFVKPPLKGDELNISSIFRSFLGIPLVCLISLSGCQQDSCDEIPCINGSCLDEVCQCDSLYEGEDCSIYEREKFLGEWTNGLICGAGSQVYPVEITQEIGEAEVSFSSAGPDQLPISGIVTGRSLDIPDQTYGLNVIRGEGGIDELNQTITLNLVIDYGSGNLVNCISGMERE